MSMSSPKYIAAYYQIVQKVCAGSMYILSAMYCDINRILATPKAKLSGLR